MRRQYGIPLRLGALWTLLLLLAGSCCCCCYPSFVALGRLGRYPISMFWEMCSYSFLSELLSGDGSGLADLGRVGGGAGMRCLLSVAV